MRYILHILFSTYTIILFARIALSWFPNLQRNKMAQKPIYFLYMVTEPYLGFFRRIIPPIGGMLDLSPILGFLALRYGETFLLKIMPL